MKGLRKILRVSWTAKKTNEWVLDKAEVKRELLDTVKARKLAYYGHTMRKLGSCLKKEIMQGTIPGAPVAELGFGGGGTGGTNLSVRAQTAEPLVGSSGGALPQSCPWVGLTHG